MFYGFTVSKDKPHIFNVKPGLVHITNASLRNNSDSCSASLLLSIRNKLTRLCTLLSGSYEQQLLNIYLSSLDNPKLIVEGKGEIDVCGYAESNNIDDYILSQEKVEEISSQALDKSKTELNPKSRDIKKPNNSKGAKEEKKLGNLPENSLQSKKEPKSSDSGKKNEIDKKSNKSKINENSDMDKRKEANSKQEQSKSKNINERKKYQDNLEEGQNDRIDKIDKDDSDVENEEEVDDNEEELEDNDEDLDENENEKEEDLEDNEEEELNDVELEDDDLLGNESSDEEPAFKQGQGKEKKHLMTKCKEQIPEKRKKIDSNKTTNYINPISRDE